MLVIKRFNNYVAMTDLSTEHPRRKILQLETLRSIGCSFKFILKVGVEESIVNAPLVSLQSKNTNNAKRDVRFKQLIRDP
jgi:hypothetical protein